MKGDEMTHRDTILTALRRELDAVERALVVMHETPDGTARVLLSHERIVTLLGEAQHQGYDVAAEANRVDFLTRQLHGRAERVVALVERHGSEQVAALPVWHAIVALAAERRTTRRRRLMLIAGGIVALAVLIFGVLPAAFPPTPTADTSALSRLVLEGDLTVALERARDEAAAYPADRDAALWVAALEQAQGIGDPATRWERARALEPDDAAFLFNRANILLQLNLIDDAEADGRRLAELPAVAAFGWLIIGGAAEQRGDAAAAEVAFTRAAELAEAAGDAETQALARVRLGLLLQTLPPVVAPTPTP
jgi:tetratricopeptide (TPR) repeat protein